LENGQGVNNPKLIGSANEKKAKDHQGAQEIRDDHDRASVEAIGNHAGQGTKQKAGNKASYEQKTYIASRTSKVEDNGVKSNGVKPVADLTDYLSQPELSEGAILPQQLDVADWPIIVAISSFAFCQKIKR
jgi:hypothetical protein